MRWPARRAPNRASLAVYAVRLSRRAISWRRWPRMQAQPPIARQAAENPRHLDYLTALAEHAGEIADALEAGQSASNTSGGVSASDLDAVRARLDEALG